jgi:RNA polymerase sigma-70 factor, ECF subfamily
VLGLSYEEAAQSLEVPIGTIRSRVARARSALVATITAADAV